MGLDIFPIEYLPRDEKERELQEKLVTMASRIEQLAKNVGREDYDSAESETKESESEENIDGHDNASTLKESVIEEISLYIDYLEENCKLQIDHQLL